MSLVTLYKALGGGAVDIEKSADQKSDSSVQAKSEA